ncbi:hypothetical protein [Frigoribacterium sp. Leaf172]|uniref:hypothetical protein n=1 Tax=Frigoribacterium sp. Leaf172 TaxID=1736285 RepID=UPI0007150167|nr:hypothetical protein [Frigoribacterium sp. Leaf172]KQR64466.1 hypothetical protein ASF89_08045 [Frigoribacterium sp. Leaf172]
MPAPLPRLLTAAQLSETELRVAALDGEVYPIGDCWAEIATPDDPVLRASSVAGLFGRHVIAARDSAAWILMAPGGPPWRHFGIVPPAARHRGPDGRVAISEMTIDGDEIVDLAGVQVTTPARTALDIARASGWSVTDRRRVDELCRSYSVAWAQIHRLVERRSRLPHRRRAEVRLRALLDPLGAR